MKESRPDAHSPTLSVACRARTIVAAADHIDIRCAGARLPLTHHGSDRRGNVVFAVPDAAPECARRLAPGQRGPRLDLIACDIAPNPSPNRMLARVIMRGDIIAPSDEVAESVAEFLGCAEPSVLFFHPLSVTCTIMTDGVEHTDVVNMADYITAGVDPLAGWEKEWVAHLATCQAENLQRLAYRLGHSPHPHTPVIPVRADSYGLHVDVSPHDNNRTVALPFLRPVVCGCDAVSAFNTLMERTLHNAG